MEDATAAQLAPFLARYGLVVQLSNSKGRCLIASRAFKQGAEVLAQEPYVAVLDGNSQHKRCDRCFSLSSNLKRCSACKSVFYCCILCQKKEWLLHKYECQATVKLFKEKQRTLTSSLRLMLRLWIKRRLQAEGFIPKTPSDCYEICKELPTHMANTGEERLVLYAQMANLVQMMVDSDDVEIKEVTKDFCRFACNAHTICDEEMRPLGTGLYPVISIINHSCSPNAVLHFDGKHAVVRALENINKGTEVTISYVELAASTRVRRLALKDQYYFDCDCVRCIGSETQNGSREDAFLEGYRCINPSCEGPLMPDPGDSKKLICDLCGLNRHEADLTPLALEAEKIVLEASAMYNSGNIKGAMEAYGKAKSIQQTVCHPLSVNLMRTHDNLLKIYMDVQDWTAALEHCRETIPSYKRAYSSFSPLLGLQFYTLGKLAWLKGNTAEAIGALKSALHILQVTHGSGPPLVQSLSSTLNEALAEAAHLHIHVAE
ncbi:hypothetical protein CY35_02G163000 [Sphagnum magellanicum]|nr:hypothetical protein CY35_02G163000 [Sphagnum magellanicum]